MARFMVKMQEKPQKNEYNALIFTKNYDIILKKDKFSLDFYKNLCYYIIYKNNYRSNHELIYLH